MVTIDDGFVIRASELKHGPGPHIRWVFEFANFKSRDPLQFGERRSREDRLEHRFQFGDAVGKHLLKALAVYPDRFLHEFRLRSQSGHGLGSGDRTPDRKTAI